MAHWSFLLCNQENSSLEIQSCQIRCFHQGIVPAEVAHVFGNPAPAGKPCYLAEGTRCSPYILHKCSVFHIYQKVWEIILFSILLLLLLAIKLPPSRDVSISWCWPHKELCFIITVRNPLSEAIWLRLYNGFLTERTEGDAAGKKNPLLCRCGDGVDDDDAYENASTLFNIFPFFKRSFLSTTLYNLPRYFIFELLTSVNFFEHCIFCRPWFINLSCSSSLQSAFCRSLMITGSFRFWALLHCFETSLN